VIPSTPDASPASVSPSASTAGSEATSDQGTVVVDVAGLVHRPGIVELSAGSRVVDALRAAGGAKRHADLIGLNLARPLVDGEQVVVGVDVPVPGSATSAPTSGLAPVSINLNTATTEELETLPGIGPVTAAAILQWRDEHGGFTTVDELLEVSGIGPATMADIEPLVHV
jgi:competence protein ComEA